MGSIRRDVLLVTWHVHSVPKGCLPPRCNIGISAELLDIPTTTEPERATAAIGRGSVRIRKGIQNYPADSDTPRT